MAAFEQLTLLIAAMLLAASLFVQYQISQLASAERLQNRERLLVWWIILFLCVIVFKLGLWAICLLVCGLLVWAVVELHSLFGNNWSRSTLLCLVGVIALISLSLYSTVPYGFIVFALAIVNAAIAYRLSTRSSLSFVVYFSYICLSLFSILLLAKLANGQGVDFSYLLLMLFFMTSLNDIAQYVSGSIFGNRRIAPSLSPNKTVAGLIGGVVVSSVVGAFLLPTLLPLSSLYGFAIGIVIGVAGFLGDLGISKLKRGLRVKDSGNSIAGHGGILDRLDSLLLTAPVFGLVLKLGGQI